jgi:hypothetical protein
LDLGVTTSLDKLGYKTDGDGENITRESLEEKLLSNIESILGRVPIESIEWDVKELI